MAEPSKALSAIPAPKAESPVWEKALDFSCTLTADLALPDFTLRRVLELAKGQVIDSRWHQGVDVPMLVNGRVIAWAEFEVVDNRLALRLTELA
jgi:flagellar motor switch protein FliN/FliY